MASDIKLNGNVVVIEGTHLMTQVHDLMMDNPSRRKRTGGYRRALVHDFQDGLTINYGSDYPNGVTVRGVLRTQGNGFECYTDGKELIAKIDGRGNLTLGKKGADGDIYLKGTDGNIAVRIDPQHFNAASWPKFSGDDSVSQLSIINEMKKMKIEIIKQREEIDNLKRELAST